MCSTRLPPTTRPSCKRPGSWPYGVMDEDVGARCDAGRFIVGARDYAGPAERRSGQAHRKTQTSRFSAPTTPPELQSPLRSLWEPDAASESCPIYVLRMRHARGGRGGALRTRASTPRFCPGEGSCKRSFFLSFSVRVCPRARLLTPLLGLFRRRTGQAWREYLRLSRRLMQCVGIAKTRRRSLACCVCKGGCVCRDGGTVPSAELPTQAAASSTGRMRCCRDSNGCP